MEMPLLFDYKENSRALGLADMAKAITDGRSGPAPAGRRPSTSWRS